MKQLVTKKILSRCHAIFLICVFTTTMHKPLAASEPYCGVYCMFSCAQVLDNPIEFEALLQNEYIIGWEGSSIESLEQAAHDIGLQARPLQRLAHWDLRMASNPLILHVRSDVTRPNFDHWVVYLGETDGQARVLDPSHGEQIMSYSDLLAIWDGAALALARSESELRVWQWSGLALRLLGFFAIAGCAWVAMRVSIRMFGNRHSSAVRSSGSKVLRFVTVGCAVVVLAFGFDRLTGTSVLGSSYASRTIANLYAPVEFPLIMTCDLAELLPPTGKPNQLTLIDARMEEDFGFRHLPGAVSIPVNCATNYEQKTLEVIDKSRPVVVYCQSEGCSYGDAVAKRLLARGFENIRIYREGVVGWTSRDEFAIPSDASLSTGKEVADKNARATN